MANTPIGITHQRNTSQKFGIQPKDRRRHVYAIGTTGTGKTTLLERMAIHDINQGSGVAVVDPHGDFVERLLHAVPPHRADDVVYFNPADRDHPIGFNVFDDTTQTEPDVLASGIVSVFKKIWGETSWGPRLEYLLRNIVLSLTAVPNATLLSIMRVLVDEQYRKTVISHLEDPVLEQFWHDEFANYNKQFYTEAVSPIQNKVGQFTASPRIRNIVGQPDSAFNLRKIMDNQQILLVNLSHGAIGEDSAALLGSLIITKLQLAAMERVHMAHDERTDFHLYVDEFQRFSTRSFATILSEARKYGLTLTLAHQYIAQLPDTVREAIFGNVGTFISFRVGAEDARYLQHHFHPTFAKQDLMQLPNHHIYVRLMVDGMTSAPFRAKTLPPVQAMNRNIRDTIVEHTRNKYAVHREHIETHIADGMTGKDTAARHTADATQSVTCWQCSASVDVPFAPDGSRPIYCDTCFKRAKQLKQSGSIDSVHEYHKVQNSS